MKKIRNLKLAENIKSYLAMGATIAVCAGLCFSCENYENKTQEIVSEVDDNSIFFDEDGTACYYFEPGQHKIRISRYDAFIRKITNIDGYVIDNVTINGWNNNNEVVYINKETVLAKSKSYKNGRFEFDDFGVVVKDKNKSKNYQK